MFLSREFHRGKTSLREAFFGGKSKRRTFTFRPEGLLRGGGEGKGSLYEADDGRMMRWPSDGRLRDRFMRRVMGGSSRVMVG